MTCDRARDGFDRDAGCASRRSFLAVAGLVVLGAAAPGCRPPAHTGRRPIADAEPDIQPVKPAPLPSAEPVVRVRVHAARDAREPLVVKPWGADGDENSRWVRLSQPGAGRHGSALRAPLRITLDGPGWSIIDQQGYRAAVWGAEPVEISPAEDAAVDRVSEGDRGPQSRSTAIGGDPCHPRPAMLAIGQRRFPGRLMLVSRSEIAPGAFDVVNHVALEQYLPGVVARELYPHWHPQTHAAQAVAARSFACSEHVYFKSRRHFDMTDGQSSQVYGGAVTHRTSIDAVAETRGEVLGWDGMLISAYYSSCCGGVAARAVDAIGPNPINDLPPLHGRSGMDICTAAPVYSWSINRDAADLSARLSAFGESSRHSELSKLATVTSINAIAHNEHGRPTIYRVRDAQRRSVDLPAEILRRAANHVGEGMQRPDALLRSSNIAVSIRGGEARIDGRGFGHGVGLCQYGAEHLARQGRGYAEILRWYYPGAEIVRAYT